MGGGGSLSKRSVFSSMGGVVGVETDAAVGTFILVEGAIVFTKRYLK